MAPSVPGGYALGPDSSAGGAAPRQEQSPDQKQQSPLWGAKGDFQPSVLKESTGREELEPSSGLQESEGCLFGSVMLKEQTGHFLSSPGHCPRNGKRGAGEPPSITLQAQDRLRNIPQQECGHPESRRARRPAACCDRKACHRAVTAAGGACRDGGRACEAGGSSDAWQLQNGGRARCPASFVSITEYI